MKLRVGGAKVPAFALAAVAVGLAFWLSMAALAGFALWRDRTQTIAQATQTADTLTALMEEHTARTFQLVDLALQGIARELESRPHVRQDPALRASMRARLKNMPYVRALYVIGPDGNITQDTDFPSNPHVSLADRDYFKAHLADPMLIRAISAPLQSRSGSGWFIAMTRRAGGEENFKGVVVAAIELHYFSDLYRRLGLGAGQTIVLFHRDSRLLAQFPPDASQVGRTFGDNPLFKTYLPQSRAGVHVTRGPPLQHERIFSYHALESEPLVVGVSYDMAVVLATWKRTAAAAAVALLGLLLFIAALVFQFVRDQAQRQRERERLVEGEKLEALGHLTGSIAHDFGNLLAIVNTNLELVRRLLPADDERAKKSLALAKRAVDRGARLTGQLMSFARRRELRPTEVDLNEAIAEVQEMLQQAAGTGVEVVTDLSNGLSRCVIDKTQFEVALVNLVINARDAMTSPGRIVLRTSNCTQTQGKPGSPAKRLPYVCLTATDTGIGMTDDVRRRALEPFFTTKGERGTGFGLPQVYGFVRQVGGDVGIDSAPGKGTSVHLYFPATKE